jgi:hypothetical protein
MIRQFVGILCCLCLLVATSFAGDQAAKSADSNDSSSATRDPSRADVKGVRSHHRYPWAIVAGAALGAGVGALLPPGSGKSAAKGLLIGGSLASLLYLSAHKNEPAKYRPAAWIITNAVLGGGIGWSVCNCGNGFPIGAALGGGFTGVVQAIEPRHHPTLSKYTGATPPPPPPQQTAPQQQTQPPPPPQNPPQNQPPPESPEADEAQAQPPQSDAENLPDSPRPNYSDLPPLQERL